MSFSHPFPAGFLKPTISLSRGLIYIKFPRKSIFDGTPHDLDCDYRLCQLSFSSLDISVFIWLFKRVRSWDKKISDNRLRNLINNVFRKEGVISIKVTDIQQSLWWSCCPLSSLIWEKLLRRPFRFYVNAATQNLFTKITKVQQNST